MHGVGCVLRVARDGPLVVMRVEGKAGLNQAPTLRRLGDECLAQPDLRFRVDLSRCDHLDSTFIGTLICLARGAKGNPPGAFALCNLSECCRQLLQNMHLLKHLPADADVLPTEGLAWTPLPLELCEGTTLLGYVVQAHQGLADLPDEAGAGFRGIATELARELPKSP
jgi:anti-anti-sigma regulatory factor